MNAGLRTGNDEECHFPDKLIICQINTIFISQQYRQHISWQFILFDLSCPELTNKHLTVSHRWLQELLVKFS